MCSVLQGKVPTQGPVEKSRSERGLGVTEQFPEEPGCLLGGHVAARRSHREGRSCFLHFTFKGHILTVSPTRLREAHLWLQDGPRVLH